MSEEFDELDGDMTQDEAWMVHDLMEHLALAYLDLMTAVDELEQVEDDERATKLREAVQESLMILKPAMNDAVDNLPGFPSQEETDEIQKKLETFMKVLKRASENRPPDPDIFLN